MAASAVSGGFPVNVTDDQGKQYGIPLSAIAINPDGTLDLTNLSAAQSGAASKALNALLAAGVIKAAPASAPVLAMTLTATIAGEAGNQIAVTFANVTPNTTTPGDGTVDVTIAWTDRRAGLTVSSIGDQLGTPGGGTAPSLVALKAAAAKMPAAVTPPAALGGTPPEYVVNAPDSSEAFTLVTSYTDPMMAGLKVEVADINTAANSFTLIVTVDFTQTGVKLSALPATLAPLVTVAQGAGGFVAPAEGTVTLAGGAAAETSQAKAAKAIVQSD